MKKIKNLTALLLAGMLLLNGCTFLVEEESVLTNPKTDSDVVASESPKENANKTDSDEVASESPKENANKTDSDVVTNNDNDTQGGNNTSTPSQQKPTTTTTKNKEPKLSGKLELQIFTNESAESSAAWSSVISAFEKETGVKVTAHIGSQVNTQMSKRWIAGNPPDVVSLNGAGIPDVQYEKSGMLYDMTDLLKNGYVYGTNDKIWNVVDHGLMWRSNEAEKYYRAGIGGSAYGVFYDSAFMKKQGLTVPTNYEDLGNYVKALKSKGIPAFTTYGSGGSYPLWSMVMPAMAAYGQDFLDDLCLGKKSAWTSKNAKSVLQRWYDFCRMDGAILKGSVTFDHTLSQMKWLQHEAALVGSGIWLPWETENLRPAGFQMEYITSPLTLKKQKPAVVIKADCMMIASKAKNLENAKAFIRFLYRKEVQEIFSVSGGNLGARTDMNYASLSGMDPSSKKILSYISSSKVKRTYEKFTWGDLNTELCSAITELMAGSMTVNQAVDFIGAKAK